MSNNKNNKKTLNDVKLSEPKSWIGIFCLVVGLLIIFVPLAMGITRPILFISGFILTIVGAAMILLFFLGAFKEKEK